MKRAGFILIGLSSVLFLLLRLESSSRIQLNDQLKTNSNFSEYCEEQGEWEMVLRNYLYIKRSAVYYFIEAGILKLLFVGYYEGSDKNFKKDRFEFRVTLSKNGRFVGKSIHEHVQIHKYGDIDEYMMAYFHMKLKKSNKLEEMYSNQDFDSMHVVIVVKVSEFQTRPLKVKIKYLLGDHAKKKSLMHCSKSLFEMKEKYTTDLDWWIKVHMRLGYEKKNLNIHMIEDADSFNKLAGKYHNFLDIDTLKCIPNLQLHPHLRNRSFLKSYTDLTDGKSNEFRFWKYEAFVHLSLNECYLSNIDKYRFIMVGDLDEIVLPKQIRDYETFESVKTMISSIDFTKNESQDPFATITCDQNSANVENYINNYLIPKLDSKKIVQDGSLHFNNSFFLSYKIVDTIFESLKSKLQHLNISSNYASIKDSKSINILIEVVREDRVKEFQVSLPISFTISSRQELGYALSLLKLYENHTKPFLRKYSSQMSEKVGRFGAVFFIGNVNQHVRVGKSIHSTRRTMDVFVHYMDTYMKIRKRNGNNEIEIVDSVTNEDYVIPREIAYMSHFRRFLPFNKESTVIPFAELHFDLNYFKCYLIPMMDDDV
jgi:hypothetical protein